MNRFRMVLRTTAVRLSALYLALFLLCAVVLIYYVTALSSSILKNQTQELVHEEVGSLAGVYRRGGVALLISSVDIRSRQPGANLYVIAAPNGRVLAGNVEGLQPGVLDREGWTETPFSYKRYYQQEEHVAHTALAEVILLPNGMRLLVGRDLGEPTKFRSLIRGALALALGIMAAGALVIWFFVGRRALVRIERMSQASRKILAGDLSQRLPIHGSYDEFDNLSQSLNAIMGRIEQLNVGLRQVSDNIAHDLKTPLTRLRNRAEAALAMDGSEDDLRMALEEMLEESDQIIRTFNALLMISRVEAGSSVAEKTDVDLSGIAADVLELYEPVAEDAGVALVADIAEGVTLNGNRELIGQALSNLVDNAIKYSTDRPDGARVDISLKRDDGKTILSVADNGSGIPEESREEVKKRFVRLDKSRNRTGNGLGLSLVEAIVSMHHGALELSASDPQDTQWPGLRASMVFSEEEQRQMGETLANGRLADLKDVTIKPFSPEARDEVLEVMLDAAGGQPGLDAFLRSGQAGAETVLAALTLSEYLRDIAVSDPVLILEIAHDDPADYIDRKLAETRSIWRGEDMSETALMAALRKAKKAFSLAIALYDLARICETRQIVAWWSQFAETAIGAATDFMLVSTEQRGAIVLRDRDEPSRDTGFFILGMGKLGAEELNYSSDIDLVVIFDPAAGIVRDPDEASNVFSKLVRSLVRILQERTPGGYVFRTDLRLRPDPGATPVAISYNAALVYYEARGQNWERAAFIKARPVAGDIKAGNAFCGELTPFVFRKYLDYATIADIHSIKRQIHAHKGLGKIAIRGHNVKLGRGGIREIEFFVQTQQLIAGGRAPELRVRSTDDALAELARFNWVDQKTEQSLREAYWYLRDVENRIQMRRDEQQHAMPESDKGLRTIALMMGYDDTDRFVEDMLAVLNAVQKHYSHLFEHEKELSSETGNLVFTGDSDDPDTIETLSKMGFERPSDIARIIRTWHSGRYNATRSSEARERLTELMPTLLKAFSETKRADEALIKFDEFLSRLPAGVQLFSLLQNNQNLCSLIVSIMASAPRLSETISRRPHVFDGVIDRNLLSEVPVREYLADRLAAFLKGDFAYEEILDRLRIFAADQKFLIGVRLLTGAIRGDRASQIFSDLADLIMDAVLDAVCREFEFVHGRIEGGQIAVVGMGKLGSMEMTASSDIDIIVLYAHAEGDAESDGKKSLDAPRYYARLTQRLVAALSSPTAEGVLYEVDLRLRPSGNKGPIASSLMAFRKYQFENAWTWEHMALTRARIVAGDEDLADQARGIIKEILASERDPATISADIHEMRARILEQKPPESIWDIKLIPGGLIDIEFIAQYLSLVATSQGFAAPIDEPRTLGVLERLAPDLIGLNEAAVLVDALTLYTEIMQIVRLCLKENYDPEKVPAAFDELLLGVVGMPDMAVLENKVRETAEQVTGIFASVIRPGPGKPPDSGQKKVS